jgi:maltose alpha-D-glucosyltransferase/alpha-amylase
VAHFQHCVPVIGAVEYVAGQGDSTMLDMLQSYVDNQGDGWNYTLEYLERFLEQSQITPQQPADAHGGYLGLVRMLGQRTGELHQAFAMHTGDPSFDPVPIEPDDLLHWSREIANEATLTFEHLTHSRALLNQATQQEADALLARRDSIMRHIEESVPKRAAGFKIRHHGDYHLGQVLLVNNDFIIIDFEGEPERSLDERRQKHSALKDVAGMLRSFNYAMHTAMLRSAVERPGNTSLIEQHAHQWESETAHAFLDAYRTSLRDPELHGSWEDAQILLELFVLEKTLYELRYELDSRPEWVRIPLRGILDMTADAKRSM